MNNNEQNGNKNVATISIGLPPQMNITDICRGAQTGWPQLVEAMKKLVEDPQFRSNYVHSYASVNGNLIGQPKQLLDALIQDPTWLTKNIPPSDVYAWSVWLTMRVYEAAENISVSLKALNDLVAKSGSGNPNYTASIVKDMFAGKFGLSKAANIVSGMANDFTTHLKSVGGDFEVASKSYQEVGERFGSQKIASGTDNILKAIYAYPDTLATANQLNFNFEALKVSAAKVTAFAVISNMTLATQSLTAAWEATREQFEAVANYDTDKLGDINFLQKTLSLENAANQWSALSDVTKSFLKRALVLR